MPALHWGMRKREEGLASTRHARLCVAHRCKRCLVDGGQSRMRMDQRDASRTQSGAARRRAGGRCGSARILDDGGDEATLRRLEGSAHDSMVERESAHVDMRHAALAQLG